MIGFTKTWSRPSGVRADGGGPSGPTPILDSIPEKVLEEMKHRGAAAPPRHPRCRCNVYCFLASDEASYVNGAVIEVSGG